jgi:RND superfamily putative drug exporter
MALQHGQTATPPPKPGGILSRLAAIPSGKRTKWLVLVAWIVVVAIASPFAGKLGDVEENDAEAWLPASAESLAVSRLQEEFPDADTIPAVVVYHRDGGLTAEDRARIEADRQAAAQRFPQFPPSDAVFAQDGQAALLSIPLPDREAEDEDWLFDDVDALRELVGDGEGGLQVKVTGPAGFTNDLVEVFGGLDSTLLVASASVVAILLLLTYRSPFVWLIPLLSVAFAHQTATAVVYGLAKEAGLTVNGQSGGILPVLVFGAGTDYALLLIARYREELRRHEDKHEAMAFALRQAGPAMLASGGTVIVGLLCLLAADLNSNQSLGPVGAVGIAAALLAMLTLLPAVLVIFGRRLFWPFVPRFGAVSHEGAGLWSRIGTWVGRRPRPVWVGTAVVLAVLALGLTNLDTNLAQEDQFRDEPDSLIGQRLLAQSFPAGAGSPAVVIADKSAADAVQAAIVETPGVVDVRVDGETDTLVAFAATLDAAPSSQAASDAIDRLRDRVHAVPNANAVVGGDDAVSLDVARANADDRRLVMPLVLIVVLVILALLLRAIVAPLLLIATVVLSFGAALGASTFVFEHVFDFAAVEGSIPLLGFVFLVALGVDYNIFLMSRVHEESAHLGTRQGMLKGLAVTGGVITSAGIVLAATFAVLGVLPLVSLTELGFIVAFGVLLDALIVRSILVPALTLDLDDRVWWPSRVRSQVPRLTSHVPGTAVPRSATQDMRPET